MDDTNYSRMLESKEDGQRKLHSGKNQVECLGIPNTCKESKAPCEENTQLHTCSTENEVHKKHNDLALILNLHETSGDKGNEKELYHMYCEPCLFGNIHTQATMICKTCKYPEPLCSVCAQQHIRQKATKGHEVSEERRHLTNLQRKTNDRDEYQYSKKISCDPCLSGSIQTEATSFCQTCKDSEAFCEDCAVQHTRQRATKGHEICSDMKLYASFHGTCYQGYEDQHQQQILCDPCITGNIQTEARSFCQTCKDPEAFCEDCSLQHTRQRATKGHEICSDMKLYASLHGACYQGNGYQNQQRILCDPCLSGNIQTQATSFCQTCKQPEAFCKECALQHTRQRATKGHEICSNMKQYTYLHGASYQEKTGQPQKQILCDPCMCGNIQTEARSFCQTCKDPEAFCEDCSIQHTRQRATKEHKICSDMDQYPTHQREKEFPCGPCLCAKIQIKATKFCKTCEDPEPLCESCAQQHYRQKATRGHNICDDFTELSIHQRQKCSLKEIRSSDYKLPGKPLAKEIKSDSILLFWEKPQEKVDNYQVRFKLKNADSKWKFADTSIEENFATIQGLMAYSEYIFQVRKVDDDQEGPYGPVSDVIKTHKSSATTFLELCVCQNSSNPPKYLLPIEENKSARNKTARTRQLVLGTPDKGYDSEKTIMLVGATGSGKSTLVDGIVNFIMGVSFEDPFRFTVVTLEEEEKKNNNQAISQTEWITVYKIYPTEGSRLDYTLNIIDTPGFGDTRGIERDNAIVDQIRHLFSAQGDQGVLYIDAVCFLVKAPDARLTVVQKYIFHSIMSLFGKDIEGNICTLITFADGAQPPVLASLKESGLPFGQAFNFNNSALFAENRDDIINTLSPMFWEMGCDSFKRFFIHISDLETKSLCQTKGVLEEREQLKTIISNIQPQVTAALSKLAELNQQLFIFQKNQNEIKDNKNFEYTVTETRLELRDLPKGQFVTNCLECQTTCHKKCKIADDSKKRGCASMNTLTGKCRICTGHCTWSLHKNTPHIFEYVTENVKKTYAEMKERYEDALGQKLTYEKYIEQLTCDVEDLYDDTMSQMKEMNDCKTRLKEIALRPDPLSMIEHIDLMIQSEKTEKQPGFLDRVKMLQNMKEMALVDKDVEHLGKDIQDARNSVQTVVGKTIQKTCRISRPSKKNIFVRGFDYGIQFVKQKFS